MIVWFEIIFQYRHFHFFQDFASASATCGHEESPLTLTSEAVKCDPPMALQAARQCVDLQERDDTIACERKKVKRVLDFSIDKPQVVRNSCSQRKPKLKYVKRKSSVRKFRRINTADFKKDYGHVLGPYLTELCAMKIIGKKLKKLKYTPFQIWLSINIFAACGASNYYLFKNLFKLPSICTLRRYLSKLKSEPGVTQSNAHLLYLKVAPKNVHENLCWILMDEMSLKEGIHYDERTDNIVGYCDDGKNRSNAYVNSSLVVKVVGLTRAWKYPLGYFFNHTGMDSQKIAEILLTSIKVLEAEGLEVLGVTTDAGANFDKMFRENFAVTESDPFFKLNNKTYYVCKDPPHLVKNARNYLNKGPIKVPGIEGLAEWKHVVELYDMNNESSMKITPRLTGEAVSGLIFGSKMKVSLAVKVLSNSVSASLRTLVQEGKMEPSALATSAYCKKMNDIFDCLNSLTSKDKNPLRKPLTENCDEKIKFLQESIIWLRDLQEANKDRPKPKFITGMQQSINVVIMLRRLFTEKNIKFLSTRRLSQDPLELFFGKIRNGIQLPTAANFADMYCKIAVASLMRAPITANCQEEGYNEEQVNETCALLHEVSFIRCPESRRAYIATLSIFFSIGLNFFSTRVVDPLGLINCNKMFVLCVCLMQNLSLA